MDEKFSVRKWLTTTNHKRIGILYLVTSLYFLILAGALAMLMRSQLAVPDGNLLTPFKYTQAITLHGLIMILWVLSPLGIAFANYFVPLQIGAKDLAFPRLNAMSYWLYLFSGLILTGTVFLPGGAPSTGWTMYAPLDTTQYSPQLGMTLGGLAVAMLAASVTMSSVNFITTIVRTRTRGMTWSKMPPFTWSVLFTNSLMLFAFPPLAVGLTMLTMDRVFGTVFFSSIQGGSILWDQLFWFFGHPEVYIVVLPALGVMAEVISTFSGRPLFGKKIFVAEMGLVTVLSAYVWVHHMFMTGIAFDVLEVFSFTTMAISIPFEGVVLNMVLTLHKGSIKLKTPMLFALGAVFFVILGGITGVFQASIALDEVFRGSYWVVGHFHYVMVGTTIFGLIAALYYWFPKITGKAYNEKLGRASFYISFIGFNILYLPYFFLYQMPRRVGVYADLPGLWPYNLAATIGAFIFGPAVLLVLYNVARSLRNGKTLDPNPWDSHSTEWTAQFVSPENIMNETEREQPPESSRESSVNEEEEKTSFLPIAISIGVSLFLTGFVLYWPISVVGLLTIGACVIQWFKDDIRDKYAKAKESLGESWPFATLSKEKTGLWVFLASEIVIFGSLISSYLFVRSSGSSWPIATEAHDLMIGTTNTLILLTSGLVMTLAYLAIKNGNTRGLKAGLIGTFVLGAAFLTIKLGIEWPQEIAKGFVLTSGLPASTYYTLMGAHALHVGVGLAALSYLIAKAFTGRFSAQSHTSVELIGIYWSFVDVVWMFLFPLFYLI